MQKVLDSIIARASHQFICQICLRPNPMLENFILPNFVFKHPPPFLKMMSHWINKTFKYMDKPHLSKKVLDRSMTNNIYHFLQVYKSHKKWYGELVECFNFMVQVL